MDLNMADEKSEKDMDLNRDEELKEQIPPWAKGEKLRSVERDVMIPKIMRQKAKVKCKDLVDEFTQCIKGRTVTMAWKCRAQNSAMKECLAKYYQDPEFFEECKDIYLKERESFQTAWMAADHTKKPRKDEQGIS